MRLSRTDLVPVLTIVAGGVIGASVSFSLLGRSPAVDVPAPEPAYASYRTVTPDAPSQALFRAKQLARDRTDRADREAELIANFRRLEEQRLLERDRMDRLAGAPGTYSAVAPPGSGDLYACAVQQLRAMGYGGMMGAFTYVRSRKDTDQATDDEKNSALSVTIIGQDMHVTAGIITRDKWDMGHGAELMDPTSGEARGDAQRLLAECAGSTGVIEAI